MLVRNVDIITGNTRAGNKWKISVLSFQFCFEHKATLNKTKPYKKKKDNQKRKAKGELRETGA